MNRTCKSGGGKPRALVRSSIMVARNRLGCVLTMSKRIRRATVGQKALSLEDSGDTFILPFGQIRGTIQYGEVLDRMSAL